MIKYGHNKFSLDILEYCKPDVLLKREEYYIDQIKSKYNILKMAGSNWGFKHSYLSKAKMSINNTGINPSVKTRVKIGLGFRHSLNFKLMPNNKCINKPKCLISSKTRTRGINIKVFDLNFNLIQQFPSIASAALYFEVSTRTMGIILNEDIIHVGFVYKCEVLDTKVKVYSYKNQLLEVIDSLKKASILYNIPMTTLRSYIKSGKLYNNIYYFIIKYTYYVV